MVGRCNVYHIVVLLFVVLKNQSHAIQRYDLCNISATPGEYQIASNCSLASGITLTSTEPNDVLNITGIGAVKPAIDGCWDGSSDPAVSGEPRGYISSVSSSVKMTLAIDNIILTHFELGVISVQGFNTILKNCVVENNIRRNKGAITAYMATVTITGCIFSNNVAFYYNSNDALGGAIYIYSGSTVSATSTVFSGNRARDGGGAIFNWGTATFSGCKFLNNTASKRGGGAIEIKGSGVTIVQNSLFLGNAAYDGSSSRHGGDISCYGTNGLIILQSSKLQGTANGKSPVTGCNSDVTYFRVNMEDTDMDYAAPASSLGSSYKFPTPSSCSDYSTAGYNCGSYMFCLDRSPNTAGISCLPDTEYPLITNITSPSCTNDNIKHIQNCPAVGTAIVLHGQHFVQPGSVQKSVRVGNQLCQHSSWAATKIVCNAPAGIGGNYVVNVTASNGKSNTETLQVANMFSFSPPEIVSYEPYPSTSRGEEIAFTGANFGTSSSPITIKIKNAACTNVTWVSNTKVRAQTPAGSGGNLAVVINVGGQDSKIAAPFSYQDPVITNVIPTLAGGEMIIHGEEFADSNTVTIVAKDRETSSEVACDNPQRVSYTELRCTYNFQGVKGQCRGKDMIVRIDGLESNMKHLCYPGIKLENTDILEVIAGRASKSFTIKGLSVAPLSVVNVTITSPSVLVSVDPITFTFTPSAWQNVNKSISITASNGNYAGGTNFVLNIQSKSDDLKYSGVDVTKTVIVGTAPTLIGLPAQGFVSEGSVYQYSFKLSMSPQAGTVSIRLSSSSGRCSTSQTSVSFTTANWDAFQTMQISTVQDNAFFAKGSTSYQCNIKHEVDTDDTIYTNLAAETFPLSVTSTGCGLGEFLGAYNRANNGTECICSQNYYLPPKSDCLVCPDNANCATLGVALGTLRSAEGAWRNSISSTEFYECDNELYCIGGAIENKTQCLEYHTGPLCEVCETGYKKQGEDTTCQVCAGSGGSSISLLMALFACFMYTVILLFLLEISCPCHRKKIEKTRVSKGSMKQTNKDIQRQQKTKVHAKQAAENTQERSNAVVASALSDEAEPGNEYIGKNDSHSLRTGHTLNQLRILIGYFQVFSHLDLTFDVPWPKDFKKYFQFFAFINIDLQAIFGGLDVCNLTVSFLEAFYLHVFGLPMFLVVLVLAVFTAVCIQSKCVLLGRKLQQRVIYDRAITVLMFFVFLIYPGLTVRIFRVMRCKELGANGEWYLAADYSVECFQGEHQTAFSTAIFFMCVYVFGIPLGMYFQLWRHRQVIALINNESDKNDEGLMKVLEGKDELDSNTQILLSKLQTVVQLRNARKNAFKTSDSQKIARYSCQRTLPSSQKDVDLLKKSTIMQYGSLFEGYEDDVWYWEIVEMLRKALLTGGLVLLLPGTSAQVLSGLLVCQFYMLFLTLKTPYKEPTDDWLQICASLQLLLTLLGGLVLKMDDPDHRLYEETFMTYSLIALNVLVFAIGFLTMAFENVVYIGITKSLRIRCRNFCGKKQQTKAS